MKLSLWHTARMPPSSVFVYGTLMPGESNSAVAHAAGAPVAQERATLQGYTLYTLRPEGYPAVVAGEHISPASAPAPAVRGWLLHYSAEQWPATLEHLDDLEGLHLTPPLYSRVLVEVQTADDLKRAWVYVYANQERLTQAGCDLVPSGDWTEVTGPR